MLRLSIFPDIIYEKQRALLAQGHFGVRDAAFIRDHWKLLSKRVEHFNQIQEKAGDHALEDGRVGSINDARAAADSPYGYPKKAGILLQSMGLEDAKYWPRSKMAAGARSLSSCRDRDLHSYVCPIRLDVTIKSDKTSPMAIMIYLDLRKIGYFCWIGRQDQLDAGFSAIHAITSDLTNFSAIDPEYQALFTGKP